MYRDFYDTAAAYSKCRDSAVIQAVSFGNLIPMRELFRKNRLFVPEDRILLKTAHQLCCYSSSISEPLRKKSEKWILEQGTDPKEIQR